MNSCCLLLIIALVIAFNTANGVVITPPPGHMIHQAPEILVGRIVVRNTFAHLEIQDVIRGTFAIGDHPVFMLGENERTWNVITYLEKRDGEEIILLGKPRKDDSLEMIWSTGSIWPLHPTTSDLPASFSECRGLIENVLRYHELAKTGLRAVSDALESDFGDPDLALAVLFYLDGFAAQDFSDSTIYAALKLSVARSIDPRVHNATPIVEQLLVFEPSMPSSFMAEYLADIAMQGNAKSDQAFVKAVRILEARRLVDNGTIGDASELNTALTHLSQKLRVFDAMAIVPLLDSSSGFVRSTANRTLGDLLDVHIGADPDSAEDVRYWMDQIDRKRTQ